MQKTVMFTGTAFLGQTGATSVGRGFSFYVVDSSFVGDPEWRDRASFHEIKVTAALPLLINLRLAELEGGQLVIPDEDAVTKVLFHYGRKYVEQRIKKGILSSYEERLLTPEICPERYLDVSCIPDPDGFTSQIEVDEQQDATSICSAVILTALPVEYKAASAHLTNLREDTHPQGTVYGLGDFLSTSQLWKVAIVEVGAGNPGAAMEAERAIQYYRPDVVLFVGIAGGIKDVTLGDVVAATKVYWYESGKAGDTFHPRPEVGNSTYRMVQRARAEVRNENWLQRTKAPRVTKPQAFVGPIAAGEKVVASTRSEIHKFIQSQYGDTLAVEMEGFGFLKAIQANLGVEALVIRGISDLIDRKAEVDASGSQGAAAQNASAFAFEILANLVIQNRTSKGKQKPQLRWSTDIDFSPPTPADEQAGAKRSWFVRLRIENSGQAPATNCLGRLLEVVNEKGESLKQFDSLDLYWRRQDRPNNYRRLDIHENGDFQYLDIAQVKEAENLFTLRVVIPDGHRLVKPPRHVGRPEDLPPGAYYVRIAIYADNASIEPAWFKVEWEDDYSIKPYPCNIEAKEPPLPGR
jgi:nucleoside phosphorylase